MSTFNLLTFCLSTFSDTFRTTKRMTIRPRKPFVLTKAFLHTVAYSFFLSFLFSLFPSFLLSFFPFFFLSFFLFYFIFFSCLTFPVLLFLFSLSLFFVSTDIVFTDPDTCDFYVELFTSTLSLYLSFDVFSWRLSFPSPFYLSLIY